MKMRFLALLLLLFVGGAEGSMGGGRPSVTRWSGLYKALQARGMLPVAGSKFVPEQGVTYIPRPRSATKLADYKKAQSSTIFGPLLSEGQSFARKSRLPQPLQRQDGEWDTGSISSRSSSPRSRRSSLASLQGVSSGDPMVVSSDGSRSPLSRSSSARSLRSLLNSYDIVTPPDSPVGSWRRRSVDNISPTEAGQEMLPVLRRNSSFFNEPQESVEQWQEEFDTGTGRFDPENLARPATLAPVKPSGWLSRLGF